MNYFNRFTDKADKKKKIKFVTKPAQMKKPFKNFILILLVILFPFVCHGQGTFGPEPPELIKVTVDPTTGYVIISWHPSPSTDVEYYAIEIIIIQGLDGPTGIKIGQVPATDTTYVYQYAQTDFQPDGYSVYAIDSSDRNGISTRVDSTIFTTASFDSCQASINLQWNDYNSWRGELNGYNIYQVVDNSSPVLINHVNEGTQNYTVTNVQADHDYGFYVEAVSNNGLSSNSNMKIVPTAMSRAPAYINADYATLNSDNTVKLSFTLDPASELNNYILMRASSPAGKYDTIANLVALGSAMGYTDNSPVTDGPSFYRLAAVNNCNRLSTISNTAGTIYLTGQYTDPATVISWNPYSSWLRGVDNYRIYRRFGDNQEVSIGTTSDTTFTDNEIATLEYSNLSGEVCYTIEAAESPGNPYYPGAKSKSNELCISIQPKVKIPNAFSPNNDGLNDTFHPLLSYIPQHYLFQVFDRWGTKVFETTDPNSAWDGTIRGKSGASGVYVYFLELTDFNNKLVKQNGHVTLVYP